MCSYASNQGDICSRMRHWEPCYFGPVNKASQDLETWEELEYSAPIILKGGKCSNPSCGNVLDVKG